MIFAHLSMQRDYAIWPIFALSIAMIWLHLSCLSGATRSALPCPLKIRWTYARWGGHSLEFSQLNSNNSLSLLSIYRGNRYIYFFIHSKLAGEIYIKCLWLELIFLFHDLLSQVFVYYFKMNDGLEQWSYFFEFEGKWNRNRNNFGQGDIGCKDKLEMFKYLECPFHVERIALFLL